MDLRFSYLVDLYKSFFSQQQEESNCPINQLPIELMVEIFSSSNFTAKDLLNCASVCKRWNLISQDDVVWNELIKRTFKNEITHEEEYDDFYFSKKEEYKTKCEELSNHCKEFKSDELNKLIEAIKSLNLDSLEGQKLFFYLFDKLSGSLNIYNLVNNFQKFEIQDETTVKMLARSICLSNFLEILAKMFQNFCIQDEETKMELAEIVGLRYPKVLAENIQNFNIQDEEAKIKLARIVFGLPNRVFIRKGNSLEWLNANEVEKELQKNVYLDYKNLFKKMGWEIHRDLSLILRLGFKNPSELAEHIQNFDIQDEKARIKLAKLVGKENPKILAENIQNFDIQNEKARIKLAFLVGKQNQFLPYSGVLIPSALAKNFKNFDIHDEEAKFKLAMLVGEKDPAALAKNFENFGFTSGKYKIKLANFVGKKNPTKLKKYINNFGLSKDARNSVLALVGLREETENIAEEIKVNSLWKSTHFN